MIKHIKKIGLASLAGCTLVGATVPLMSCSNTTVNKQVDKIENKIDEKIKDIANEAMFFHDVLQKHSPTKFKTANSNIDNDLVIYTEQEAQSILKSMTDEEKTKVMMILEKHGLAERKTFEEQIFGCYDYWTGWFFSKTHHLVIENSDLWTVYNSLTSRSGSHIIELCKASIAMVISEILFDNCFLQPVISFLLSIGIDCILDWLHNKCCSGYKLHFRFVWGFIPTGIWFE